MRAFWILLRRELFARWMLFVASLGMGGLVVLLPLVTGTQDVRADELRGAGAVGTALVWSLLLAIGLGASCFGRDLSERRLAFDFRLPAPATSLWAARLVSAYLTAVTAGAGVLLLPAVVGMDFAGASAGLDFFSLLVTHPSDWRNADRAGVLLGVPFALAALLLLANLLGLALSGSRGWSGLDLFSALLAAGGATLLWQQYRLWGANEAGHAALSSLGAFLVLGLLAASWWQVAGGRVEPGRAHARASASVLACVVVAGIVGASSFHRHVHPGLDDLATPARARIFGPELAALSGRVAGRAPIFRFLVDRRTGESLELGPSAVPEPVRGARESWPEIFGGEPGSSLPIGTRTGPRIVWLARERSGFSGSAVRAFELARDSGDLAERPTALTWSTLPVAWTLSTDGHELVTRWPGTGSAEPSSRIVVEQLATGGTTRVLEVPSCGGPGPIACLHPDRLLVACGRPSPVMVDYSDAGPHDPLYSVDLREIHLPSGTIRTTGGSFYAGRLWINSNANLRALRGPGWILRLKTPAGAGAAPGWELVSPRTGRTIRELPDWGNPYRNPTPVDGLALPGGRILVVLEKEPTSFSKQVGGRWVSEQTSPGRSEVHILSTAGETLRSFQSDQRLSKILSVDDRGALLLGDRRNWDPYSGQSLIAYRLDLDTGVLQVEDVPGTDLPYVAGSAVGIATREPNRNWLVRSDAGTEMLFTKPNPAWGPQRTSERSTGQVSTPLKRR